ncbi:hypothetical protein ABFA07_014161 [Porites harrisoni]
MAFVREACVLLMSVIFIRSAESFQFINTTAVVRVVLEFNKTAVNQSISCRTDDPNASTILFFNFQEEPVGGRISLDNKSIPFMVLRRLIGGFTNVRQQAVRRVLGQFPRLWFLLLMKR